jgi:tetratricopeptide (TPR) repeat protein
MHSNEGAKKDDAGDMPAHEKGREAKPADYLRAVRSHLKAGKQKEAFKLLQEASFQFPDDPLVLSYYGCMQAVVDKKCRSGVDNCRKALVLLKRKELFEEEILYPVFYLNLGRAYVAAGKKQDALTAFYDGLQYDRGHSELKKELRALGERKQPAIPFLDRSNPINKYIGMLLRKGKNSPSKTKTR